VETSGWSLYADELEDLEEFLPFPGYGTIIKVPEVEHQLWDPLLDGLDEGLQGKCEKE
jgi:hypothetical protein